MARSAQAQAALDRKKEYAQQMESAKLAGDLVRYGAQQNGTWGKSSDTAAQEARTKAGKQTAESLVDTAIKDLRWQQNKEKAKKTQKVKADRIVEESTPESDTLHKMKSSAEEALKKLDESDIDWTDANARKVHEQKRKELQAQIDSAGASLAKEEDSKAISSMSEEDKKQLERYAVSQVEYQNKPVELSDPNSTLFLGLFGNQPNAVTGEDFTDLFGKVGGKTRADELAETYMRDENAELNQKVAEKGRALANAGRDIDPSLLPDVSPYDVDVKPVTQASNDFVAGVLSSAASVPLAAVAGTVGTVGQLQSAARSTGRYGSLDPNATGTALQTYSSAIRDQVGENLTGDIYDENGNLTKDGGLLGDTMNLMYQVTMNFADTIARAYIGGGSVGGSTLAGLNTFSQTMAEASEKGATPAQAALLATANAFVDAITEKIPLDKLVSVAKGKDAISVFKNVVRQAGLEITEEELSLLGSLAAEAVVLKENSDFNQTVTALKEAGMTEDEAKEQAWKGVWDEAVQTALVSGLAGGLGGLSASLKGQYADPGEDYSKGIPATPEPLTEAQPWDSLYQTSPEAQAKTDAQRKNIDDILEGVVPKNHEPVQAEAPSRADEIVNKTLEDIGLKKPDATAQDAETPQFRDDMTEDEFLDAMGSRDPRNGVEDPMADRNYTDVGKRNVNAYQYENPEVKPYFQEQAAWMLSELQDTVKAERGVNAQAYYESGGENGYYGNKRLTSDSIAELRDQYGMSYNQIEQGLYDIIQDAGSENNAAAKRIEFVLNDRLMNGYTDFYTGKKVAPNADYLNMLKAQQSGSPTVEAAAQPQANATKPNAEPTAQATQPSTPQVDTSKVSAEGGQPNIEAVGAAEQNFTGKPTYNSTLSEDNAQADRASDVRSMELPETDVKGNPVSAVTGNVYGSTITPNDFASLMEEPTARGDFSYVKITNDQATQKAMETIGYFGDWDTAYSQWSKDVGAGKTGAEMAARGALLLNQAAQEGNKKKWLNILADMQDLGTNTAQGLQAFRILRDLSGNDKVAFMELSTKRLGEKMGIEFSVDQSLYDAYNKATTPETRNAAIENIQQAVADQVPSTLLDKWNALRYTNMLGNMKTNVRNIAGNVAAGGMYRVKDQIAATMEDVLSAVTGGKFERTKSHTVGSELLNACKDDFDMVSGIVGDGGKYGTQTGAYDQFTQGVMDKRRIFKSDNKILNAVYAPMEEYRKLTNWAMNNEYFGDEAFGKAAYARSLAGYLKAHGVTDADLSKVDTGLMDKARSYAVREAQEATFHDNSALANVLGKLKRDTGVIGEGIMPFTKTPANVLVRAEEFSPLGFVNTAVTAAKAAKGAGEVTGADVVNSLSKSLTGAGIFALGAWLKQQGFLTGGPDSDEDKDGYDSLNGDQNYALRFTVGGKTYNFTFDWLSPTAMPLFMGSQFMDIMDKGFENMTFADLEQVFTNIADPMLQMSMLQGLNDSLDNIKYTDNNLGQFFINAAVSYLTQGFGNTLLGQIERSTEKYRMTTYVDKDSQMPQWLQKQLGSLSQKIPGWDFQQTEYINARGEMEENEGGNVIGRLFYNLFSPGYISEEKSDKLSDELYRLNDSVANANVFPDASDKTVSYTDKNGVLHKDVNLTADQYSTYASTGGKTATQLSESIVNSPSYAALTDEQKAKAIQQAYSYAKQKAEIATFPDHTGYSETWMKDMPEGKEADYIIRRVAPSQLSSAMSSATSALKNGYDLADKITSLDAAYDNYLKMDTTLKNAVLEDSESTVQTYITAREKGVSTKNFLDIYGKYKEISDNKDLTTSEKAQDWSVALDKAERDGTLTATQKKALKDKMVFRYTMQAETAKYDEMRESGISIEKADQIIDVLDKVVGTGKVNKETGEASVRPIDKYTAITNVVGLTDDEIDAILEDYMPDYDPEDDSPDKTYLKYDYVRQQLGISPEGYIDIYNVYLDGGKKAETISRWTELGYSSEEANVLYNLFKATGKKKIDVEAWYADQVGQRDSTATSTGTSSSVNTNRTYQGETLPQGSLDDFEQKLLEMLYGTAK